MILGEVLYVRFPHYNIAFFLRYCPTVLYNFVVLHETYSDRLFVSSKSTHER